MRFLKNYYISILGVLVNKLRQFQQKLQKKNLIS